MLLIIPIDFMVWYQGIKPPENSQAKIRNHMITFLAGNCLTLLDKGYAIISVAISSAPVPNTTRLIEIQKELKNWASPTIDWYEVRLKPTGHSVTNPAAAADLSLKERHRVYQSGRMVDNAKISSATVTMISIRRDPSVLSFTISDAPQN